MLELLKDVPNLKVEISAAELLETMRNVTAEIIERYEKKEQPEEYITRKQTAKKLDVNPSTLWRWERENYLVPIRVGGKVRYRLSDVERIMKGGCYDAL